MVRFSSEEIEYMIGEDVPYFDLTTHLLGIEDKNAKIRYITRDKTVICGTEEVFDVFKRFSIHVDNFLPSGSEVPAGTVVFEGNGNAGSIHKVWKVCVNILEYSSGISTRTKIAVDNARAVNPDINVTVTRKIFPGTKKLSIKAVLCGGAVPHRLGLSETILIFDEHIRFLGGMCGLQMMFDKLRKHSAEKKIEIEVHNTNDAVVCTHIGADILQVDKMKTSELAELVRKVKSINPDIKVAAAGGVNLENIAEYTETGVDIIVTSAMYFGKPSDIKAEITPL